jgi:sugar phosphate isomerase/epimerase
MFVGLLEWDIDERIKMAIRFSLAHLTVLGCAPPEMTYIAARAGYDLVSFRIIMMGSSNEMAHSYVLAENKDMLRQTKTALADTGLEVHDIELARIFDGVDLKTYLPAFEIAAELGARHVICSIWTSDRTYAIEQFIGMCDLAKSFGLTVNLEFLTWTDVANLRDASEILRAANCDNAGILVDMLHFHRSRVKLEELDELPPEWFNFVHLCDASAEIPGSKEGLIHTAREERLYVGEGGIDVGAIVGRLPEIPYSIELPHLARARELGYAEHARRCLETAKAYFASSPRFEHIPSETRATPGRKASGSTRPKKERPSHRQSIG